MNAFGLHNVVVQIIDVAKNVVAKRGSCSRLKFKNNFFTIFIVASRVNLGTKEHFTSFSVPEVIFL
jgi:hypothetical protein